MIVRDEQPALWPLEQDYTGPDGQIRTRTGFLARVRVEDYGPGRIRPHERTHPGPKEDRLRLTRATQANLSPIFSLFDDPAGAVPDALDAGHHGPTRGDEPTDDDGTVNRLWRIDDADTIATVHDALDGDRAADRRRPPPLRDRARVRRGDRRRGPAPVRADVPGRARGPRADRVPHPPAACATCAPTSRRRSPQSIQTRLRDPAARQHRRARSPVRAAGQIGYIDAHFRQPFMLTLKDQAIADAALAGPRRALPPARHRRARGADPQRRARDDRRGHRPPRRARIRARLRRGARAVLAGDYDAAFFVAATPIEQVREVAAAGESMPPKSTYFFPKVPTGLLFNPLSDD